MTKKITEMSNKELKKEYEAIIQQIEVIDCFGINDLLYRGAIEKEIEKRNLEIQKVVMIR